MRRDYPYSGFDVLELSAGQFPLPHGERVRWAMSREIRIKITKDGRVEIDSSVYKDCKEVADYLVKNLGRIEKFEEKDDLDTEVKIEIDTER